MMRLFVLQMGLDLNTQVVQEQVCSLNHTISNKLYHLGHYATVFQAEVYAIRICVSYLCDEVNASIAICSDSQAALKALAAAKTTSQLVLETMKALTNFLYITVLDYCGYLVTVIL